MFYTTENHNSSDDGPHQQPEHANTCLPKMKNLSNTSEEEKIGTGTHHEKGFIEMQNSMKT